MIELPPLQFDYPYQMVIETIVSKDELERVCGQDKLACTIPPNFNGDKCFVYLPNYIHIKTLQLLRRHEIAHCNGWKH